MKQKIFLIMLAFFIFPLAASALSNNLKHKYPYTVLTDDYGLLNEIDLDSELDGVKHPPVFSYENRAFIYWQCFPRDSVTVSLEDLGYSPEDDDESDIKYNGENKADLIITAHGKGGVVHKYTVWGRLPIMQTEDRFNQYLKLMHNEKHVCLAGAYMEKEVGVMQGRKQQVHYWVFEKVKTNKGCEAYHQNGCHYGSKT